MGSTITSYFHFFKYVKSLNSGGFEALYNSVLTKA